MKAREARKLLRAAEHHERKAYIQKIDRAFKRLSAECSNKVLKAITQAPDWRVRPEPEVTVKAHIDAQAARIAELELKQSKSIEKEFADGVIGYANSISNGLKIRAEAAEKELAALREQKPIADNLRVVPLDALGAACGALQLCAPDSKTLALLRRYTFGDLSKATYPTNPVAVPDEKPAALTDKLIDWVCLTCVAVRNAAGDFEAQDSINEIRSALESLRLNSGSKPECTRCRDGWRPDEMGMITCDCDKGKAISLSLASGNGGTVSDD